MARLVAKLLGVCVGWMQRVWWENSSGARAPLLATTDAGFAGTAGPVPALPQPIRRAVLVDLLGSRS